MQTESNLRMPSSHPERETLEGKNKISGVWFFLGGECVLFASLIGTFLGLRGSTAGGPTSQDLFSFELVFIMTVFLLVSSLTSVLGVMAMQRHDYARMQLWFGITVLLGLAFLACEIYEFVEYVHLGLGYTTSAFASAFYTLVGFHGAHVTFGVGWITALIVQARRQRSINTINAPKFYVASLYWHFIDVVWVFIFTIVYLMGMVD